MSCCIPFCKKSREGRSKTDLELQPVTFHEFPTNEELRNLWLQSVDIKESNLPDNAMVCSEHFPEDNFDVSENGLRELRGNAVPSVFTFKSTVGSDIQVCLVCLDTAHNTKMNPISKHNLIEAYINITGLSMDSIHKLNYEAKLCVECGHRLLNCNKFRDKCLRGHHLLSQIADKHGELTGQNVKTIDRVENNLTSNIEKVIIKPYHYDLYLKDDIDSNLQEIGKGNSEKQIVIKIERDDDPVLESEVKEEVVEINIDYESSYLSGLDAMRIKNNDAEVINIASGNDDINEKSLDVKVSNSDDISEPKIKEENLDLDIDNEADELNVSDDNCNDAKSSKNIVNNKSKAINSDNDNEGKCLDNENNVNKLFDKSTNKSKRKRIRNKAQTKNNVARTTSQDSNAITPLMVYSDDLKNRQSKTNLVSLAKNRENCNIKVESTIVPDINNDGTNADISIKVEGLDDDDDCNVAYNDYVTFLNGNQNKNSENTINNNEGKSKKGRDKVSLNNVIFVKAESPLPQLVLDKTNKATVSLTNVNLAKDKSINSKNEVEIASSNTQLAKGETPKQKVKRSRNRPPKRDKVNKSIVRQTRRKTTKPQAPLDKVNRENLDNADSTDDRNTEVRSSDVEPVKDKATPKTGPKLFKITELTHEEQLADVRKRMESKNYKNAVYTCTVCYKGYVNRNAFDLHMDSHTDKFGTCVCPVCGVHTFTKRVLKLHIKNIHKYRHSCTVCPFVTKHSRMATLHERWHNGIQYTCKHCGMEFIKHTSYMTHVRLKHPSDVICAQCGYSFINARGLKAHMRKSHRFAEPPQNLDGPKCETCDIRFANAAAYEQHIGVSPKHNNAELTKRNNQYCNTDKRTAVCDQCGAQVKGSRGLLQHLKNHHRVQHIKLEEKAVCEHCGKVCPSKQHLRNHQIIHMQKRFQCNICQRRFSLKTNLAIHMGVHSASRPQYHCPVCGRGFSHKQNRQRHMLSAHDEKRPLYQCKICDKTMTTAKSRDSHILHVHNNVPRPKRNRRPRQSAKATQDTSS